MSTSIGSVKINLEAVDNVSEAIGNIKGSISGLSGIATTLGQNLGAVGGIVSGLGGPFDGLGGIISGFAKGGPAGAGIAMIGEAVGFLQGSVKAAEDSERVMAILRTTVENQGIAWDTVKGGIDKTLQSMQATTRFSDEELAQALGTLMQHGMDVEGAMKALNTAMDTATGTGKPLQTIVEGIGKAYEGQDTALTRLVPAIGDLDEKMGAGATSGDKFQATLGLLNDRFGGTAAADAATFAGVQERMANAWDQFQETIGNAVLPALTNLMNGLMTIGTEAIGPLMESLGELWSALFGEDVDLSGFGKFILDSVITVLKGLASFIKEDVVPTVKMIHEAFQTASEIIGPPLKMIADAVGGFIKTLHDAFEGFYNWLVGGSLWMDMWNQLLSVASELVGKLLGDLGTKLFEPMKNAFTGAMQAVEDSWNKGWEAVHAGFETVTSTIQTGLNTKFDEMKSFVQTNLGEYGPIATGALDTMQSAMNAGVDLIKGDWQGALDHMQVALTTGMQTIGDLWDKGWQNLQTVCTTVSDSIKGGITVFLDSAKTTVGTGIDNIKTSWETGWQATQAAFTTISQQIGDAVNTKFDEMKAKVQTSTGEYAPVMTAALSAMQSGMNAGMDLIKGDWQGALDHAKDALNNWGTATKGVMDGIMNGLQGAVKVGLDTIKGGWDTFVGGLQSGVGTLQSALDSAGGSVQQALDAVGAATTPATSTVTDAFTSAFTTISTAATSFWNWLTGHSLWPDMLDRLSGVTRDKLLDTASAFSRMFGSIEQELSNRFQNMFGGTKGAMGMILQVIASSLIEIRDNFMSTIRNVEASWSDAWTEINRVAASTTQQVFNGLTTWWSMLQANFMTGLTAISGAWQTSWTSILETVANICGQIGAGLTAWYQLIQDTTTGNLTLLTGTFQTALITIQSGTLAFFDWMGLTFSEALAVLNEVWQTAWTSVETILSDTYVTIQTQSMEWWTLLTALFSQGLSGIYTMFTNTFSDMASAAQLYMSSIAASVANAFALVQAAAAQMKAEMVTGSIWPDMLAEMQAQATSALGNIVGDFQGAFGDVALSVPTIPSQAGPSRGSEASAPLISQLPQSITIPITITLDGRIIAQIVEKRLAEKRELRERSLGRFAGM